MTRDLELSEEEWKEIAVMEAGLISRLRYLQEQRADLDRDIAQEIKVYNNVDANIDAMPANFRKTRVAFVYSQVQTIVARLIRAFFDGDNFLKLFMEREEFYDIQEEVTKWAQEEIDCMGLKDYARDYFESALVSRTAWLVLRASEAKLPISPTEKMDGYKLEFDVHPFNEVWFDTKAKEVMATDFFVKKVVPVGIFHSQPTKFFNLEKIIPMGRDPYSNDTQSRSAADLAITDYSSKHSSSGSDSTPGWHGSEGNGSPTSGTDLIEVYEYWGPYDFSTLKPGEPGYKPDIREINAIIVNGNTLVHWEENPNKGMERKRLLFPIRPIAQAGSLISKSIPQITRLQAEQLNLAETLRMTNYENLIGLLFKYNKNADIDISEIFNGSGNAIGWDESPQDIEVFQQPNLIAESSVMINDIKQDIQMTTGAVDAIVGGTRIPDTASGQQTMTQQALFKFQMMAENCAIDLRDVVNYSLILNIKYNRKHIEFRYPKIIKFLEQSIIELEKNYAFDISLKDAAVKRDVEQAQWANMVGIIGPLIEKVGGNVPALVKELLLKFGMAYPDKILKPETPEQIITKLQNNPSMAAQVMQALAALSAKEQGAGASGGTPAAVQTDEAMQAQLNRTPPA